MFLHLLKNRFKVLSRNKEMIFWTLIFPIVMTTFFKVALSNIATEEEFQVIPLAIVESETLNKEENLKKIIDSLSEENDDRIFDVKYVAKQEDGKELLENKDVAGYIYMNEEEKVEIFVKENGIEQTIIKYVIDEYYQLSSVAENMIEYNPQVLYDGSMELLTKSENTYLNDKSSSNLDYCMNYYYTAIAMACMYGGLFGIDAVKETEANLSKKAARVNISPVHKLKMLFVNLFAGFIIQYLEVLVLLAYVIFLGGDFGGNLGWVMLVSLLGCFAGTTFGTLVGVSNRKSEDTKIGILISITMAFSFCAGMMGPPILKYKIEKIIPFIKYNPITLITDGLYSLYSYTNLEVYYGKIICLSIFSIIMIAAAYVFVRRKRYDSI